MTMNNQPLGAEKTRLISEKLDINHQKAAMRGSQICVKNASPPNNLAAKTFSGRGATPHRR
ncbi:hypothetical protein [Pseudomonas arsenicoxydans]|uniref:hypothetical protein n=1 Tax=Pseudomonas arsenicoxydans TaxID=702115 RepID=UPI0012FE00E5|nr:hypothetical protein [Pseudomonas arsenicoxydans]